MTKQTASVSHETTLTVLGDDYYVVFDVDIEQTRYEERHGPGLREPMSDTLVCLDQFEATSYSGDVVMNKVLRRAIRAELVLWINDNESTLLQNARLE